MSYILSTQHPPPWARSFQDPRDAGPSSAHIPDPVFQTQPEVLSVTFYSKHTAGVCQRRAKATAAWAWARLALLSPVPPHPPGSNDGVSSHRETQCCTCHSPAGMEENHLGTGGFEGQSLNLQATRPLERDWLVLGSSLSFLFLSGWKSGSRPRQELASLTILGPSLPAIRIGRAQPRKIKIGIFYGYFCFLLNSVLGEIRIHYKHSSSEDNFIHTHMYMYI